MYIYWPVVLIFLTIVIVFLPARVLYHRSRKWWAFSNVSKAYLDVFIVRSNKYSGVFYLLVFTLLNSEISFSVTCTVPRVTPWG